MLADTAIFGPLHVAGYFTHMTLCEGGGLPDVAAKLRTDFWPTFSAELTIWPVIQVRRGRAGGRGRVDEGVCVCVSCKSECVAGDSGGAGARQADRERGAAGGLCAVRSCK